LEKALIDFLQLIHKSVTSLFIKRNNEKFYLAVAHISSYMLQVHILILPPFPVKSP